MARWKLCCKFAIGALAIDVEDGGCLYLVVFESVHNLFFLCSGQLLNVMFRDRIGHWKLSLICSDTSTSASRTGFFGKSWRCWNLEVYRHTLCGRSILGACRRLRTLSVSVSGGIGIADIGHRNSRTSLLPCEGYDCRV